MVMKMGESLIAVMPKVGKVRTASDHTTAPVAAQSFLTSDQSLLAGGCSLDARRRASIDRRAANNSAESLPQCLPVG